MEQIFSTRNNKKTVRIWLTQTGHELDHFKGVMGLPSKKKGTVVGTGKVDKREF